MEKDYYKVGYDMYNGHRVNDYFIISCTEDYVSELNKFNPENLACKSVEIVCGYYGTLNGVKKLVGYMNFEK